jgi:AraC family transcriptional regulator of adaptative response/methylated-DNA-[protein]-cysteine methyltransferase
MTLMTQIENPEERSEYRRIARAIRYLAEHYSEQPSLEEAASVSGLSVFHFQRTFSRYVGISPKASVT